MIYKSKIASLIFIIRSLFFGVGISLVFKLSTNDAVIASLIGMTLGFIIINLFNNKNNPKWLTAFYNIFIILIYILILETFITSFYLITTPPIIINTAVMFIVLYLVSKGKVVINRVTAWLFIINAITYFIIITSLLFKIDVDNYMPILSNSFSNIIKAAISFTVFSITPLMYLNDDIKKKELNYAYLIGSLSVIVAGGVTLGIIGNELLTIYRYPEYMILKEITILDFIEKIENVFAFIWGNDIIIALAINCHNLKNSLPQKYQNLIFYTIIILIIIFSSFGIMNHYYIKLILYKNMPLILGSFLVILIITKQIFKKRA